MSAHQNAMKKSGAVTLPVLVCLALVCLVLASCNTLEGVGRDVQSLGRTITGGAQDNR